MPSRPRTLRTATVTASERISPQLVRLSLDCPELAGSELPFTDHYVKFLFPPAGADYSWPFDPEAIRAATPEQAPVTRTYTLRRHDATTGAIEVDFVIHGDEGLAGPWAARATVGEQLAFFGPGGAWGPTDDYDHFVLVGDESAAPAVATAVEALPAGSTATVFLEIADPEATFDFPVRDGVETAWVARDGAPYGSALAHAVRSASLPEGRVGWFVHGVAEMIKDLRRYLFVELGLHRSDVSISGYWRSGMNEDGWQSSKHAFVAEMDSDEVAAGAEAAPIKEPRKA